ncbi:hypothetical protein OGAPHI_007016 [Ogataea philodendri]|uniref:Uncharacterized protein n=1 Tax=Ogataea philodendri TaxID=1378263 RepID=A0A9P8NVS1_9ASCO|nr:uncharacterized protein OGAPHI_007016 [Ogataea philodendri]KAH3660430.1 hypothetical protein OGAPHI_007016 [Ogataea philodendri]
MIRIGECMIELASSSTLEVIVAEKIDRRSFGFEHAVNMRSVCSTNLDSNNLSASSNTTCSTLERSITPSPRRSISLNGVDTKMSNLELVKTLLRNFPAIDLFKIPTCRLLSLHSLTSSLKIWVDSSLVGEITNPRIPWFLRPRPSCCTRGIINAKVLPEPVGAQQIRSRSAKLAGIASH